jgi:hypothetical protein
VAGRYAAGCSPIEKPARLEPRFPTTFSGIRRRPQYRADSSAGRRCPIQGET